MPGPLGELTVLCAVLFAGSMVSGYAPLAFSIAPHVLLVLTTIGAGLLVGTALIVIIPEGVATLYSISKHVPVDTTAVGTTLALGFVLMLLLDRLAAGYGHSHSTLLPSAGDSDAPPARSSCASALIGSTAMLGLLVHNAVDGFALGVSAAARTATSRDLSFIVFLAIILHKAPAALAFTTFLLQQRKSKPQVLRQLLIFCGIIPLAAFLTFALMSAPADAGSIDTAATRPATATAAAFVVATSHTRKMLHAESAHAHHEHAEGGADDMSAQQASSMHTVGLALLFSGGTFLYVATCHIMPEVMADIVEQSRDSAGACDAHSSHAHSTHTHAHGRAISAADLPWRYVGALMVGVCMPILLSSASHSH